MLRYEYRVVPAPTRVRKLTDLTPDQDRFCATVTDVLTDLGLEGWEFVGSEKLSFRGRRLLVFKTETEKTCLVFRREIEPMAKAETPREPVKTETAEPVAEMQPVAIGEFRSKARARNITRDAAARTTHRATAANAEMEKQVAQGRDALLALARSMKSDTRTNRHA